MPPTCFVFTDPIIKTVKNWGNELEKNIPPEFLPYFLEIIGYSFEHNFDTFNEFINTFRDIGHKKYDTILRNSYA